jgi:hypothetical protein
MSGHPFSVSPVVRRKNMVSIPPIHQASCQKPIYLSSLLLAFYVKLTLPPLLRSSQNQCRAANVSSPAIFYCICMGKYYPRGVLFPVPSTFFNPPPVPLHPFPPLPSKSLHETNPSLLHYLTLVPVMIIIAVIFPNIQNRKQPSVPISLFPCHEPQ